MAARFELPPDISDGLRARFERLSPEDRARVLAGLRADAPRHQTSFNIRRRAEPRAPLTFAQQGIWLLQQLVPDSSAWNLSRTWTIEGPLDVSALARAMTELIRRHESLRTRYFVAGGIPTQEVGPVPATPLEFIDLRNETGDVEALADRYRGQIATRPFDLTSPLTIRAAAVRVADERYRLTVAHHHISSDQWSSGVLRQELAALYEDFTAGRPSSLPPLRLQYNDYASWADERADSRLPQAQGQWFEPVTKRGTSLRPDDTRHKLVAGPGTRAISRLGPELVRKLHALARANDATLFVVLLSIFNLVVSRHTRRTEIISVTPTSGRVHPDLEALIGLFATFVPLHARLDGHPSFGEVLARVRQNALPLLSAAQGPVQRVSSSGPSSPARSPTAMSSLMFTLQNVPHQNLQLTGLSVRPMDSAAHEVVEDLAIFAREDADGTIALRADARMDVMDRAAVGGLLEDFARVANLAVTDPHSRTSTWSGEPTTISGAAGATEPHARNVPILIERAIARTPNADAVIDGTDRLTFRELDNRANQLARYLRTRGAGPGVVVSVLLPRSIDLVVALYAVLKTGAAYLPLDPALPDNRRSFMIEQAGATLHLTATDRPALDAMPSSAFESVAAPDDVAYVLFTSGSTGRPKGVAMPHKALVNLLSWHVGHKRLGRPARTLQYAPVSFDVSFQDIFGTLATGGSVVVVDEATRRDPAALLALIEAARIERLYIPVAVLNLLARAHASTPRPLPNLCDVISAGEALHVTPDIRRLCTDAAGCHLHNHYGPTETHVVTSHELDGAPETWPHAVPIGVPLPNVQIHLIDSHGRPVIGDGPGEILIAGDCLARGYVGRPDLTAAQFIEDFSLGRARMYRTGDRARRRADGALEFLGRLDDQVKINGYRIEPTEIATVLGECPGIREAAVIIREDRPGEKRLVGYYVPEATSDVTSDAIQQHLRQQLPRYMLPAALVAVTALPLSPHGKVDRRALPAPANDRRRDDVALPHDMVESSLVAIWTDLLGGPVGIDDDFFELGGHSILAVSMLARAEQALGRAPALSEFFDRPTIRQFAEAYRRETISTPRMVLTWISNASASASRAPLIVLPSMFGFTTEWRELFRTLALDRPVYGLELLSDGAYWKAQPTLEDIGAACLEVLHRELPEKSVHLIGHSFGGRLAYELGTQLATTGRPPVSIVAVDTSMTDTDTRPRWRDAQSIAANAPAWIANELKSYGPRLLMRRARLRWPRRGAASGALSKMFDLSKFPSGYRQRVMDSYAAFASYRPHPSPNRLSYLRCRVRPLIHTNRPDGGWGQFVPADRLRIREIPGDHGSPLHSRWRSDLGVAIRDVLGRADSAAGDGH